MKRELEREENEEKKNDEGAAAASLEMILKPSKSVKISEFPEDGLTADCPPIRKRNNLRVIHREIIKTSFDIVLLISVEEINKRCPLFSMRDLS